MKDAFSKAAKLLPKFSLAVETIPAQIYVPQLLLLDRTNAYPESPADFSKHVTLNRSQGQLGVSRLKRTEGHQVIYLKGSFECINTSVPSVVTSGNCSARWLGKEEKQMQGINYLSHLRTGLYVVLDPNAEEFQLKFQPGVRVEIDRLCVFTAVLQNNPGVDLHKLVLEKSGEMQKNTAAQLKQ